MKLFKNTYIVKTSAHLPGPAVSNDDMDNYIGPINKISGRIKSRILKENGIVSRHYGMDKKGVCNTSVTEMGARVVAQLVDNENPIGFLSMGTTGGDAAAPGLANFVQGALHLPPMETLSVSGICAASMGALTSACEHVQATGEAACAGASEFPSRLFRAERFIGRKDIGFDAHFLRWMLSDGAGAVRLEKKPKKDGKSLNVNWIHSKSFSGDFPTCMQVGLSSDGKGYLEYDSLGKAQDDGAYDLKQDIRLLTALFDVGIGEYVSLVHQGHIAPKEVSTFICHYSSEKFKDTIKELMDKAGLLIDQTLWFSNLKTAGNTGSASIFIMLDSFCKNKLNAMELGSKILVFVPESGRFTVSFAMLEVVDSEQKASFGESEGLSDKYNKLQKEEMPESVQEEADTKHDNSLEKTLQELGHIWQHYRSTVLRTPIARKVFNNSFTHADYLTWMSHWIPQVREGSVWMHRALSGMQNGIHREIGKTVRSHIGEEQFDWQILYDDYRKSGGTKSLSSLHLTAGASALNAYMHTKAMNANAWELLGGIYIIEGTGEKIISLLLPKMQEQKGVSSQRFLTYHGENDVHHLERWLSMLESVLKTDPAYGQKIVHCAKDVASLYLLHWEHALAENQ
jgi:3-oxoacyl-[acyl-carrier-protein] synthase-3